LAFVDRARQPPAVPSELSKNRKRVSVTATSYIRERENATYSSNAEITSIEKWASARGSVVVDVECEPESLVRVPTSRNADLEYESDLDWHGERDDFSSAQWDMDGYISSPPEISRENKHNSYSSCNPRIDSDNEEVLIEIEPISQPFLRKGWKKEANVGSQGRSLWLSPCEKIKFKNKKLLYDLIPSAVILVAMKKKHLKHFPMN